MSDDERRTTTTMLTINVGLKQGVMLGEPVVIDLKGIKRFFWSSHPYGFAAKSLTFEDGLSFRIRYARIKKDGTLYSENTVHTVWQEGIIAELCELFKVGEEWAAHCALYAKLCEVAGITTGVE